MAQIVTLLAGILIAALVFVSLFWSFGRVLTQKGRARQVHAAHLAAILIGMGCLTLEWVMAARLAGGLLIATGLAAAAIDAEGSRILPLLGATFGLALALGLPFAGG